jgi:hypothetical protein
MRQLKQYLRKRKAQMLACECGCRTLKCWRESTCDCEDWGTPVPPEPVISYSLSKVEDVKLINYTSTKLEDGIGVESYRLHLVYDDNDDLESASITNWEIDKAISTLQDALDLASEAESALTLATQVAYEWVFEIYKTFYSSL